MPEPPHWANLKFDTPDFQDIAYYSAPKKKPKLNSLDEVDPQLIETFQKLGISLEEQKRLAGVEDKPAVAMDVVMDSVSVATTFQKTLAEKGIIFCAISEAIQKHPDLVRKYLGSVVPKTDNFYAALNSAVFTDGSFCYVPKGVRCPMELSTYFRINQAGTGQFERTLLIVDEGAYVSYLEGCTAPKRDENQLHAAVVELIAMEGGEIKYSTVQNWFPGDKEGKGGVYNFVTKRALAEKINEIYDLTANMQDGTGSYDLRFGDAFYDYSWFTGFDQVETLRAVTCPSVLLHVGPDAKIGGYYDDNGVLLSAMDDKDSQRVYSLLPKQHRMLIDNVDSGHDIHAEKPDIFIYAVDVLAEKWG